MVNSKTLVTGGNGFVGTSLCGTLLRSGDAIKVVAGSTASSENYIDAILNIDANTDWSEVLTDVGTVIHLAARVHIMSDKVSNPLEEYRKVNVDGTLNLARQAATRGVSRFIFLSSIKVNGEFTQEDIPFTEESATNPQDAYGVSKLEAEQGLILLTKQTNMEVVIIRSPLVYGVGVKANFSKMLKMLKGQIPLPLGAIHNKRSFVYVDNLVSLIVECKKHPSAANQIFLVSDGEDLSTTELLTRCADALGVRSWLIPFPQELIVMLAAIFGKKDVAQRLCGNLQVDITKARTLLEWSPPITVAEGLKATANGFNGVN